MAKNQGQLNFGVNFNVNTASLNKVRDTLKNLKAMTKDEINKSGGAILDLDKGAMHSWKNNLKSMRDEIGALEKAFEAAYNPKLGTYELNKFNESLKTSGTTAAQAFATVANYGAEGKAALLDMTTGMLSFERVGKQTNETFKKLGDTMLNTLRWSITSTALNTVTGAIQKAYSYAVDLDSALNDIMIVTDKSSSEMEQFAKSANKAAKELGASTQDYAEASLIYYQQGLGEKETKARTETTLKVAAITGQSASAVSEQLTAVWNGYKVSAEEAELYIDKLSAVAATTGADLEELSIGMSRVASAANIMGVDVDSLNAQLATIVSVTREAPETIGTALKTVYARMSDIEAGLDSETTLGEYTSQMARMGINVLDANGKLRDMEVIIEEIGGKWNYLNREQQVSLAQSIAGTRQYSRMMALFDNWDMYQEAMTTSIKSAGTLSAQHIKYLDSIEAHQNKLKASAEELYDTIFDSDQIKGVYDLLSNLVTLIDGLVKGLGGMPGILATAGLLLTTFGKQSIQNLITQHQQNKLQKELYKSQIENGKTAIKNLQQQAEGNEELKSQLGNILELENMILNNADNLTEESFNSLQASVKQYADNLKSAIEVEKQYNAIKVEKEEVDTETGKGQRLKRTFKENGKRIATYNLRNEESNKNQIGRAQARKNLNRLQNRVGAGEKLSKKEEEELEFLKKYLPLAEKKEKLDKKIIELDKAKANAAKVAADKNKQLTNSIKETISAEEKAGMIANITQGFTQVGFSAAMAAGSVQSFSEIMNNSEAGLTDWIGAISGGIGVLGSLISQGYSTVVAIKKVKAESLTGAAAWTQYWSAATFGISLIITALTTVLSIISESNKAQLEASKERIEEANKNIENINTNKKLLQSYLDLYQVYEKTGDQKEQLISAADAVIEAYKREDLQILKNKEDYEGLTAAIKEARIEENRKIIEEASRKKREAENILQGQWNADTEGFTSVIYSDGEYDTFSPGLGLGDDDQWNIDILKKYIGDYVLEQRGNYLLIDWPETAEEKVDFYNKVKAATQAEGWRATSKSEINDSVQAFLNDPEWKQGVQNWQEASTTKKEAEVYENIATNISDQETSVANFASQRESQIQMVKDSLEMSDNAAAFLVDKEISSFGGNIAELAKRDQWLRTYENELGGQGNVSLLRGRIGLNQLSNTEFSALSMIDVEDFNGNIDAIIAEIPKKLKQIRDEAWAGLSEDRLEALEKELDRLERVGDGKNLTAQVQNLMRQTGVLVDTYEVSKVGFNNTIDAFLKDVSKNGVLEQLGDDLNNLIANGNWEELRNRIENINMDNEDARQDLLDSMTKIMQASNDLTEIENNILEQEEAINEKKIETLEKVLEAYEKQINYLESTNDLLDHQKSLIELIYGEQASPFLQDYYKAFLNNSKLIKEKNQSNYNYWTQQKNRTDITEEERQLIEENWKNAADAYAASITEMANVAQESYTNILDSLIQSFNGQLITSDKTLIGIGEEWDWTRDQNEKYLSPLDRAFQTDTIRLNYQKAIDTSSNIQAQQRINELMKEQLKILESQDKLSQNDLDRANQKLEILQAEIALQEAQEAKTSMRLMRGADGSYSYQYIADQNGINEQQEKLKKANQALYQLDLDSYKENLDEFYNLYQEYQDKIREYSQEGGFSQEELDLLQNYQANLLELAKDNEKLQTNLQTSIKDSAKLLGEDSTSIISEMETITNTGLQDLITKFIQNNGDINSKFKNLTSQIKDEAKKTFGADGEITKAFDELNLLLEGENGSNGLIDSYEDLVNQFNNDLSAYENQITEVSNLALSYKSLYENIQSTIDNMIILNNLKSSGDNAQLVQHYIDANSISSKSEFDLKASYIDSQVLEAYEKLTDKQKNELKFSSFDTGGYTGAWNSSEGRLAMLHEKEIVLDQQDSINFLNAIEILRSLNLSMLQNISNLGNVKASTNAQSLNNAKIEQTIQINAEFPDATDAEEIKAAFNDLINLATQKAFEESNV